MGSNPATPTRFERRQNFTKFCRFFIPKICRFKSENIYLTPARGVLSAISPYLCYKQKNHKTMNRLLLFVALFASLSATAARPTTEEILAENNFQIVSDLYQERPIWVKTYHCDSATAIRTLMMNPQIIIEREFEGRLICRMCDVRLLRISDPIPPLPIFMTWAATFYFTVEVFDDEYRVELCEAVWNGVRELSDDVDTESYTLYGCFFTKRGNLDSAFIRHRAEALNDWLTRLFAPRL